MSNNNLEFKIQEGKIQTRSLEVHIADHCNLRCAGCCSLSPLLPESFTPLESMEKDLRMAARVLSPQYLKLVGGEPLLHPGILDLLRMARSLEFAPILSVTTNGFLLGKMDEEFWRLVDAITLSRYPFPALTEAQMTEIKSRAHAFGVHLNIKVQDVFVQMDRDQRSQNDTETRTVFHECWLRERCHMVSYGRFFLCTRPPHFDTLHHGAGGFLEDGIQLHEGPALLQEIHEYLVSDVPLETCYFCKGGDAQTAPHRQLSKSEVQTLQKPEPKQEARV